MIKKSFYAFFGSDVKMAERVLAQIKRAHKTLANLAYINVYTPHSLSIDDKGTHRIIGGTTELQVYVKT